VTLFRAIMGGMSVEQQRKRFGDRRVRPARQVIVQTIQEYAARTQNFQLLRLLGRMREPAGESPPPSPLQPQAPKPVLSDKEKDYASILAVLDRLGRPAGSADLGKYRRRWLDYPPRDASSGYRNRLEEVLANMVREGVILARPTRSGAVQYVPGPAAASYRKAAS
jgi:hypothetical protein